MGQTFSQGGLFVRTDKAFYGAGEHVQGTVNLQVPDRVQIHDVFVELIGVSKCAFSEDHDESSEDGEEPINSTLYYEGEDRFLDFKSTLYSIQGNMPLEPGQFSFPFSFVIPVQGLPGSFELHNNQATARVYYEIRAHCNTQGFFSKNYDHRQEFVVIAAPPSANGLPLTGAVVYEDESSVNFCCCFNKGSAHARMAIPKPAFVPGEQAVAQVNIDNNSSVEFSAVNMSVAQIVELRGRLRNVGRRHHHHHTEDGHSQGHYHHGDSSSHYHGSHKMHHGNRRWDHRRESSRKFTRELAEQTFPGVSANAQLDQVLPINLPYEMEATTHASTVTCSHELRLTASGGFCTSGLQLDAPIIVYHPPQSIQMQMAQVQAPPPGWAPQQFEQREFNLPQASAPLMAAMINNQEQNNSFQGQPPPPQGFPQHMPPQPMFQQQGIQQQPMMYQQQQQGMPGQYGGAYAPPTPGGYPQAPPPEMHLTNPNNMQANPHASYIPDM